MNFLLYKQEHDEMCDEFSWMHRIEWKINWIGREFVEVWSEDAGVLEEIIPTSKGKGFC